MTLGDAVAHGEIYRRKLQTRKSQNCFNSESNNSAGASHGWQSKRAAIRWCGKQRQQPRCQSGFKSHVLLLTGRLSTPLNRIDSRNAKPNSIPQRRSALSSTPKSQNCFNLISNNSAGAGHGWQSKRAAIRWCGKQRQQPRCQSGFKSHVLLLTGRLSTALNRIDSRNAKPNSIPPCQSALSSTPKYLCCFNSELNNSAGAGHGWRSKRVVIR
jgi:hypothetical protein